MLILFQKENCPYCAKVRQFMSDKKISYVSAVSPKESPSRNILMKLGGKQQVPFLLDIDCGEMIYESEDIIKYLEQKYLSK